MRFLHGKLKAFTGEVIKVDITKPTRILIMPERQFSKYRENLTFTYYGGHKEGTYEFTVPKSGTWVIVIEKGTYANPIDVEVKVSKEAPQKELTPAPDSKSIKKKNKKKKKDQEEDSLVNEASDSTDAETDLEE